MSLVRCRCSATASLLLRRRAVRCSLWAAVAALLGPRAWPCPICADSLACGPLHAQVDARALGGFTRRADVYVCGLCARDDALGTCAGSSVRAPMSHISDLSARISSPWPGLTCAAWLSLQVGRQNVGHGRADTFQDAVGGHVHPRFRLLTAWRRESSAVDLQGRSLLFSLSPVAATLTSRTPCGGSRGERVRLLRI